MSLAVAIPEGVGLLSFGSQFSVYELFQRETHDSVSGDALLFHEALHPFFLLIGNTHIDTVFRHAAILHHNTNFHEVSRIVRDNPELSSYTDA